MYATKTMLHGKPLALLPGFVKVLTMEDQLGPQVSHGLHLDGVGVLGQTNDGPGAEETAGVGDGLAVVARGGRDHSTAAFLLTHVSKEVYPTTDFKGTQGLVVLVLEAHFRSQVLAEGRIVVQWCTRQIWSYRLPCLQHVLEGRPLHPMLLHPNLGTRDLGKRLLEGRP